MGISKRRIFFGKNEKNYQIFNVSQNKNDGSIYFSTPKFEEIIWSVPAIGNDLKPVLLSYQLLDSGKLSLHGSGITHVRPHKSIGKNEFVIRGNPLRSQDGKVLKVKHLLTIFLSEPSHTPNSPARARESDYIITTKSWHPYVIIFWAVPLIGSITIKIGSTFHIDDLEEKPPNAGWGAFELSLHAIVWFAYRTKFMQNWPSNSQAFYSDGHTVPIIIGTSNESARIEYRQPKYNITKNDLSIML